ncbi:MAG: ABC transporter ATP-binding protein [Bdellovibrionales bacterium]|nr:ABC transporter ATP-binding protein [Bdellovibrionales bacterium]
MTDAGIVLSAKGIGKSFFKGGREVSILREVDLEILAGETLAIMGASGAGKSTLLHVLGTLEPPTCGKVFFGSDRRDLFSLSEREISYFRNRSLGFVFQFHYLLPEFTALENVMMPALIAGYSRGEAMQQAKDLLDFVGLAQRLDHRPAELSGGEQQRVAVARSVILRPKLLLADELTGNLDSANNELVMALLAELHRATGVAILLVTHDAKVAQKMQRVLVMKDGALT